MDGSIYLDGGRPTPAIQSIDRSIAGARQSTDGSIPIRRVMGLAGGVLSAAGRRKGRGRGEKKKGTKNRPVRVGEWNENEPCGVCSVTYVWKVIRLR